jgi:hypothetical protein
MRKTLAVLVLMTSSLLLLQAPAWAHELYRVQKKDVQGLRLDAQGRRLTVYEVLTDCPSSATLSSDAWSPKTVTGNFVDTEEFEGKTTYKYFFSANAKSGKTADLNNTTVTCTMAFTGRSVAHQLLLGTGLLLLGTLFLVLTGYRPLAVFKRKRPGPTPG